MIDNGATPGEYASRLQRGAGAPLWRQLLADLRVRLAAGEFAGRFPGELDLVAQYSVSRHTVREALRQLRNEGLLDVARGRRARLAEPDPPIQQRTGIVYSLFSSVEAAGLEQRSVVLALTIQADGVIAPRLGLEESTPLVYLERLRLAGAEPLALDRVWLPASIGEPLLELDFTHTSLYDQLQATTGISITGGEETVRAVIPSAAEHRTLGLVPPSPAFAVQRTGVSHAIPVEWRFTLIRGDRFSLITGLAANAGVADAAPGALSYGGVTLTASNT